jgi:hypothetical protein
MSSSCVQDGVEEAGGSGGRKFVGSRFTGETRFRIDRNSTILVYVLRLV